jgi:hypothetical protein
MERYLHAEISLPKSLVRYRTSYDNIGIDNSKFGFYEIPLFNEESEKEVLDDTKPEEK